MKNSSFDRASHDNNHVSHDNNHVLSDDEEREIVESFEQALDDGTLVSRLTPERQMELRAAATATLNQFR